MPTPWGERCGSQAATRRILPSPGRSVRTRVMKAGKGTQERKAGPEGAKEESVFMGEAGKASTMKDVGHTSSMWGQRQAAERPEESRGTEHASNRWQPQRLSITTCGREGFKTASHKARNDKCGAAEAGPQVHVKSDTNPPAEE
jgi:hypothetical protein